MVEPFLIETKFRMPLGNSEAFLGNGTASYLKMSEMYSLEHWNELSGEQNISPLISWEMFVEDAPGKLFLLT